MKTVTQTPVNPPQPRHRPQLPPAHWPVIDAWLATHMPRPLP